MKKVKKAYEKFAKILLLITMIFSELINPISVFAEESNITAPNKGDLAVNGVISNNATVSTPAYTNTSNDGEVQVTKTVSKVEGIEGRYQINFNVKGEEVDNKIEITKPLYLVVVFDTSNSMLCGDGFVDILDEDDDEVEDYVIEDGADGIRIKCYNDDYDYDSSLLTKDKWESAVNAAVAFSQSLDDISNTYISLVNFGGTASEATDFIHGELQKSQFEYMSSGTNIKAGINEAQDKLDSIKVPNAQKYILIIGDGKATAGGYYEGLFDYVSDENAAKRAANNAKEKGTKIYAIGYGIENDTEAQSILKYVSSDTTITSNGQIVQQNLGYYKPSSTSATEITSTLKTVFQQLGEPKKAGTSAKLTDTIGDVFQIVNEDGTLSDAKSIEIDCGEITKEGKNYSFQVQINEDLVTKDTWYDVNKGFVLEYTNYNNVEGTKIEYSASSNQPQVYWQAKEYGYVINYYKDSTTGTKLGSVEGVAKVNTTIDTDDFDENKYLPTEGYELLSQNITPSSITIQKDGVNTINVVYTKTNHTYVVNYYYNGVEDTTLEKKETVPYGTIVNASTYYQYNTKEGYSIDPENTTSGEFDIKDNTVVIDVYFKQYSYDVNYYFNGTKEENLYKNLAAIYGETILATNHYLTNKELNNANKANFFIDPTNSSNSEEITIDNEENELNIYYISTQTSNEKVEKTSTTREITNSKTPVDYKINYSIDATNIKAGSTVTITIIDTLPFKIDTETTIDPETSNLNGGSYNPEDNTVTWIITETISEFTSSKTISKEINYSVVYEDFEDLSSEQNNNLTNNVSVKTTIDQTVSEGTTGSEMIPVNIKGSLEVLYVDENGISLKTITQPEDKAVGTIYTTNQENIYGYTFSKVEKYINNELIDNSTSGKYVEGKTLIKYTYTKNKGTVETNKVEKEGPEKVKSINDTFTYTLTYEGKILEYTGDATLILTDTPDFKVKELVNGTDSRCTLNNENKIVCEETYEITETNKTINDTFIIKVKYENITDASVGNKVEALLKYGNEEATGEGSSTETEVKTGNLKVIHNLVDNKGNILETLKETTTEELGGTPYTTQKEESYGYSFDSVIGEATGEYKANTTITVEYRYTKNIGTSEETLEKIGNQEVDSINSKFDYIITYETIITDYKGNATLTIIDLLPYQIDLDKSTFNKNNCTYSYKDGKATITCIYEKSIDQENQKINILENISLYYIDVKENGITNKVESILTYGKTTKEDEYQFTTEVKEGKVKVNYVTIKNNEYQKLTDEVIIEGMIDYTYETEEKDFPNYILKEVIGEPTGIFTEDEIEVTYVYEKVTPPKTGVQAPISNGVGYINYVLILLVGLVCKKRYN